MSAEVPTGLPLYPAIDLRGGRCVRLYQGDYGRETDYGDDPVGQAETFAAGGAGWIHVVDLDAARSGDPVNRSVIAAICAAVAVPVQAGGGVRDVAAAGVLAELGVSRVVMGTAALEHPELVGAVAARQPVAVGLDARGRQLAGHGWEVASGVDLLEAARRFAGDGAEAFVVTEIARDGTLEGPSLDQLRDVLDALDAVDSGDTAPAVIASGGVGTLGHLASLASLRSSAGRRLGGAIVGRALYDGAFTLADALAVAGGPG